MGLEVLSTPMRLAVVIGGTALVLLLLLWSITRRRKESRFVEEEARTLAPMQDNPTQISSDTETTETVIPTPAEQSETTQAIAADEIPLFLNDSLTENLKVISRLSEIIAKTAPSRELKNYGQRILEAASDTSLLINNNRLIRNSEAEFYELQPATVNFIDLIRSQKRKWSTMFTKSDVQFSCFVDEKIPECLFLDPEPLNKIIDSLLTNSRNMTEKGRIHLHVTGENTSDFDWAIKLIVADTGRGFGSDFKTSINNQDSSSQATSLEQANLIATGHMARHMRGQFNLKSVIGRGTEVWVSFPSRAAMIMAKGNQNSQDSARPASVGALSGKRVLIIEDDKSSQEVLSTFLRPEGCDIDCIDDGEYALATLEETHYDLVLMDVRMNGLDGIKTTRDIRRSQTRFKDIPIIAITADTSPETNAKCMMAGVDLFLTKPVGAKGLFDAIRFVMDLGADIRSAAAEATG